jgi:hypothetical protein
MLLPLEIMCGKGSYRSMHFLKTTEYEIHYTVDRNVFHTIYINPYIKFLIFLLTSYIKYFT